jgi:hypothetical protein
VHLVTGNDYLAARDARAMQALYGHFGLTVACVTGTSGPKARRAAYRQDVVYVTGRELVFDALRDRQARRETSAASPCPGAGGSRGAGAGHPPTSTSCFIDEPTASCSTRRRYRSSWRGRPRRRQREIAAKALAIAARCSREGFRAAARLAWRNR